ncbi:hypothetical protein WHI96_02790 [Pseudonocardia tropica]|uniref:Uncharacterized protein n=1 Tax=Pseudonocardia tropica TaxID=681289 RepID=A0ABV1JP64_9PSEU
MPHSTGAWVGLALVGVGVATAVLVLAVLVAVVALLVLGVGALVASRPSTEEGHDDDHCW